MKNSLRDIATLAESFNSTLAPRLRSPLEPIRNTTTENTVPFLRLPDVDLNSFEQALHDKSLSHSLIQCILDVTHRIETDLRRSVLSRWRDHHLQCPSLKSSVSLSILINATTRKFELATEDIIQKILSTIDKATTKFARDADASAQSEPDSSSEVGLLIPRGHSRLAVKILEKAYSRTANITRAERLRLAAATKLQPRQVTIWFQNRRNRKPAPPYTKVEDGFVSPPSDPSTPTIVSKKRKADGLYDGEVRQPSQGRPPLTPNMSTRELSSSSIVSTLSSSTFSSLDSVASCTYSCSSGSDISLSSDSGPSDGEEEIQAKSNATKPRTPVCVSFDDQVQRQLKSTSFYSSYDDSDMSNTMLFSDSGEVQLDFDDLGLDLDALVDGLPSFGFGELHFQTLTPAFSSSALPTSIGHESDKTPRQSSFAVPAIPPSIYDAAKLLNRFDVDPEVEIKRAQQVEEWALGGRELLQEGSEGDDEWFLSLQGLRTGPTNSPNICTTSIDGDSSSVTTPRDIFDFTMEGLFIDTMMEENRQTFRDAEEAREDTSLKKGLCLTLDVEAANKCSLDEDVTATAVQVSFPVE